MRADDRKTLRCAIYTRKSTEHGLEQEFNSLDAQREACEAYIKSQASQGWKTLPQHYDDPAYSGGNLDRPALKKLLGDIEAGRIDVVVVYKIDRLTRSLADFAKLVEQPLVLPRQAAIGLLLDSMRDTAPEQVRAECLWRFGPEQLPIATA